VLLEEDLQGSRGKGKIRRGVAYEINEQRCHVEQAYTAKTLTVRVVGGRGQSLACR
jgi:hypothetical protein